MHKYHFTAVVRRHVLDEVYLSVTANTEDEARKKATRVLEKLPQPHEEDGVPYCYTDNRQNVSSEVVDLVMTMEDVIIET